LFDLRWEGRCEITCSENYEKKFDETKGEYICVPKECEERHPWKNGSCCVKEDFSLGEEGWNESIWGCYYLRMDGEDEDGKCIRENECPSDLPGV
jgi:hypothetical protein